MGRGVITKDAYLGHLGRSVDDELGMIEILDNTVSEMTSECPSERM